MIISVAPSFIFTKPTHRLKVMSVLVSFWPYHVMLYHFCQFHDAWWWHKYTRWKYRGNHSNTMMYHENCAIITAYVSSWPYQNHGVPWWPSNPIMYLSSWPCKHEGAKSLSCQNHDVSMRPWQIHSKAAVIRIRHVLVTPVFFIPFQCHHMPTITVLFSIFWTIIFWGGGGGPKKPFSLC